MSNKFKNQDVAEKFFNYPKKTKEKLLEIRDIIFQVSNETKEIGNLEEVLRWNQPSYLTKETNSGSIIRIDKHKKEDKIAVFFHCQTNLVSNFKKKFKENLDFEGNRAIILDIEKKLPKKILKECIEDALTYKLRNEKK
jgi:hypothetical protein